MVLPLWGNSTSTIKNERTVLPPPHCRAVIPWRLDDCHPSKHINLARRAVIPWRLEDCHPSKYINLARRAVIPWRLDDCHPANTSTLHVEPSYHSGSVTATKTNTCNISHCGCNEPPWYDGSTCKAGDDNTGKSRKKQMDLFFLRSPCTIFAYRETIN